MRQINLRLPDELIDAIDRDCATDRGRVNRTEWLADAARRKLGLTAPFEPPVVLVGQLQIDEPAPADPVPPASRGPRGRPDLYEQGQHVRAAAAARRAQKK